MNNWGNSFIHYDYQEQAIKWQNGGENYNKICFKFYYTQLMLKVSKQHTATKLSPDWINKETEKWPSARQMRVNQGLAMMIQTTLSKLQSSSSYKFLCVAGQTQYIYYVMVNWSAGGGDVESS